MPLRFLTVFSRILTFFVNLACFGMRLEGFRLLFYVLSERLAGKRTFSREVSQNLRNCRTSRARRLLFPRSPPSVGTLFLVKMLQEPRGRLIYSSLACFFGASRAFATEPTETYFLVVFDRLPLPVTGWRLSADGFAQEIQWFLGEMLRSTCFG